ncbi:MAG TPA: FtsX-like permease family protein [Thermoanaerobaculia bacterium]|nr:FtsX-like permease family protein [Thermoanaerobaculia bacterium]
MKFSKLIIRNLFRNKLRAALTVLLMAAIFFFVATLLSILENFTLFSDAGRGQNRLAVQSAISLANVLPIAHEGKIRAIPGIVDVCEMQWFGAYYKEPKNFFANFAVDHKHMPAVFDDYQTSPADFAAFANDRQGAIVGPELMKRFNWHVGDRITLKSTIFPFNPELTIRAVYKHPIDTSSLMFHMDYFQQAMGNQGWVGMFWVKVKNANDMNAIGKRIDDMFRNSTDPTETFTEKEFQLNFLSMMGDIKLLFHSISLCAIFMVILLAAITMSMSARERVTEIAVLKAIGFSRGLVLTLMLIEFTTLTLIGGIVGVVAGRLVYNVVNMTRVTQGFLVNFTLYTQPMITCIIAAFAVGVVAGGWPAIRSASMSVVDGLRRVV